MAVNVELMLKVLEKRIAYLERTVKANSLAIKEMEDGRSGKVSELGKAAAALNLKVNAMDKILKLVMKEAAQDKNSLKSFEDKIFAKVGHSYMKNNFDMQKELQKYLDNVSKNKDVVFENKIKEQKMLMEKEQEKLKKETQRMIREEAKKNEEFARKMLVDARLKVLEDQMKVALGRR